MATSSGNAERRLSAARTELERERRRTSDEIDALRRFGRRLAKLDAESAPAPEAGNVACVAPVGTTCSNTLDRVREAYEETVMSVPHYTEEYDDTYAESLTAEFDTHVTVALTEGTFDQRSKETVRSAIVESRTARRSLLAAIDDEEESLAVATEDLTPVVESLASLSGRRFVDESFGALDAYRARLGQLEETCETVLTRRQDAVFDQRRAAWLPADAPDVAQYFYQGLEDSYPVMAVVADLLERIRDLRSRVERAMTFCHA